MKYLHKYPNKESAVGEKVSLPVVCMILSDEKVRFLYHEPFEDKDEGVIKYTDDGDFITIDESQSSFSSAFNSSFS